MPEKSSGRFLACNPRVSTPCCATPISRRPSWHIFMHCAGRQSGHGTTHATLPHSAVAPKNSTSCTSRSNACSWSTPLEPAIHRVSHGQDGADLHPSPVQTKDGTGLGDGRGLFIVFRLDDRVTRHQFLEFGRRNVGDDAIFGHALPVEHERCPSRDQLAFGAEIRHPRGPSRHGGLFFLRRPCQPLWITTQVQEHEFFHFRFPFTPAACGSIP